MSVCIVLMATSCQGGPSPSNTTLEVVSGRTPNASVEGTVTYRERLALTPDASLVVELRDVSYADGDAALIARQTITGPSQVPIGFRVEYNREDIVVRVTLFRPVPTSWAISCSEDLVELDTVQHLGTATQPGQSYRVIVNDVETTTFTIPEAALRHTFIAESSIQSVEVITVEGTPIQYRARMVSGMPKGSGCSQFNGYEIQRNESNTIDVAVTHHEVADPFVVCTADFSVVETAIPLGSDFESGVKYTITVNFDTTRSFVAR